MALIYVSRTPQQVSNHKILSAILETYTTPESDFSTPWFYNFLIMIASGSSFYGSRILSILRDYRDTLWSWELSEHPETNNSAHGSRIPPSQPRTI